MLRAFQPATETAAKTLEKIVVPVEECISKMLKTLAADAIMESTSVMRRPRRSSDQREKRLPGKLAHATMKETCEHPSRHTCKSKVSRSHKRALPTPRPTRIRLARLSALRG
jgi:hypothetical protein